MAINNNCQQSHNNFDCLYSREDARLRLPEFQILISLFDILFKDRIIGGESCISYREIMGFMALNLMISELHLRKSIMSEYNNHGYT